MTIEIFYLGCIIPESIRVEADAIVSDSYGDKLQRLFNLFQRDNDKLPEEGKQIVVLDVYNLPRASVFKNWKDGKPVAHILWYE